MERLLNKREVAEAFGVTVKAIDKWVCEKKVPYVKLSRKCIRFIPSEVRAFIKKLRVRPETKPPAGAAALPPAAASAPLPAKTPTPQPKASPLPAKTPAPRARAPRSRKIV